MLRFTQVDDLTLSDHYYLHPSDDCHFLREYIPHVGYSGGETNDLIFNFKKGMEQRGRKGWSYKDKAIQQIAKEFANALNPSWLKTATLVPIPPSKKKSNPLYDDRVVQVLKLIGPILGIVCDVRELIIQTEDMEAAHTTDERPTPDQIKATYVIDRSLLKPTPRAIGLFDDLLTTGAHFRAAKLVLEESFPDVPITGFFIARRIIP